MAFTVLNTTALDGFVRKHRDARGPLANWLEIVTRANWESLADLRKVYASADGVNVRVGGGQVMVVTVFNIKWNRYRLLTVMQYTAAICRVIDVLTHEQYSSDRWKDRL